MYISKVLLDITNSSIKQSLKVCQDMHINIMGAFVGVNDRDRESLDLLYRVQEVNNKFYLYVQSNTKPEWENTEENGFFVEYVQEMGSLIDNLKEGYKYKFSLRTSPYEYKEGKKNKTFITNGLDRMNWFLNRGEKSGFKVISYAENNKPQRQYGIKRNKDVWVNYVDVTGVIEIEDTEKFKEVLIKGIGPQKAYGLGLLLLAK